MKKSIAIIGGGAAALMLAAELDADKYELTIYEKQPATGRKLLVAGDGGFNLTHSENLPDFIQRYTPSSFLTDCLNAFSNTDLRNWLHAVGIQTYIGSSKRVYPEKGIKPIELLNAILNLLKRKQVQIKNRFLWNGWDNENQLVFNQHIKVKADLVVFALGGASWKTTGSDGAWLQIFQDKGIGIIPFQASNCNFPVIWDSEFIKLQEGKPLKNISIRINDTVKKGEILLTKKGIEGGAVYALSPEIRAALYAHKKAVLYIDLKPGISPSLLQQKLLVPHGKTMTDTLKKNLNCSPVQIALLKSVLTKEEFQQPEVVAYSIKNLEITLHDFGNISKAISTVGGVALHEVTQNFELKNLPGHYAIGEMLDWDAPTGGYLLQACFSMGHFLATYLNRIAG